MSHTIESIDHYWAGDTLHLQFVVWDGDVGGTRKPLTGASFEWWLQQRGETVLSLEDSDVSVTSVESTEVGEFEIEITTGATDGLGSSAYAERLRIVDADGRQSTFGTTFTVKDPTA